MLTILTVSFSIGIAQWFLINDNMYVIHVCSSMYSFFIWLVYGSTKLVV